MITFSRTAKNKTTSALTLDLTGAYDNVCLSILMKKINCMSMPHYLINWFKHFLANRATYIRSQSKVCYKRSLTAGLAHLIDPLRPIYRKFNYQLERSAIPTSSFADDIIIYGVDGRKSSTHKQRSDHCKQVGNRQQRNFGCRQNGADAF